jgi:hypothetical protein
MKKVSWQISSGIRCPGKSLRSDKKFLKHQQSKARRRYIKKYNTIAGFEQKITGSWKIV